MMIVYKSQWLSQSLALLWSLSSLQGALGLSWLCSVGAPWLSPLKVFYGSIYTSKRTQLNFLIFWGLILGIFDVHDNSVPVCSCPDPTFCWMRSWYWNKSSPSLGKQLLFHHAKYCFQTSLDFTGVLRQRGFTSVNICGSSAVMTTAMQRNDTF